MDVRQYRKIGYLIKSLQKKFLEIRDRVGDPEDDEEFAMLFIDMGDSIVRIIAYIAEKTNQQ